MVCFNKELQMIWKDIEHMEKILPYGNLLLDKDERFRSIGYDLQKHRIPSTWFSKDSSIPKSLSIIQLIHRLFFFSLITTFAICLVFFE